MQLHQLDARIRRMLSELKPMALRSKTPVSGIQIAPKGKGTFKAFENGAEWAQTEEWWRFKFDVTVPEGYKGRVVLSVRTGREALWEALNPQFVVWVNGKIEQAFDTKHTTMQLQAKAVPGANFEIEMDAYTPIDKRLESQRPPVLYLSLDDIDEQLEQLCYDIEVPYEAAILLPAGDRDREVTLEMLSKAIDILDIREPYSAAYNKSVIEARKFLKVQYYEARKNLTPIAYADSVGHTHIDVAWLWDLEQTRHKAVRSFSTVLKLMEQYPEYKFMSSQAQLYSTVKEDAPEVYARIKEMVKQGRWEIEGGMWVEADCNLAGGESLVRQFVMGQQFFGREFNEHCKILWLPDVFGYSAALPQILKKSGIDYFMTTKLSWSEYNLSPYDTFNWKGIDGSEVLTHFSPSRDLVADDHSALQHFTTYNAMMNPSMMQGGWKRFQQKGIDNEFLVSYGYGDGGGGPTDWMIENARRMETPLPGTPVVRQMHARPFFEALDARVSAEPRLPKWSGELYLEYHRGTYTALGKNKRNNRKIELLLRDTELLLVAAQRLSGMEYPIDALDRLWEQVLTLQFHDILPGSSIKKVYDDSDVLYAGLFKDVEALKLKAIKAIGLKADVVAINTLSFERSDVIWFDAPQAVKSLMTSCGQKYAVQHVEGKAVAFIENMPSMSQTALFFSDEEIKGKAMAVSNKRFETPFFSGKFDKAMRISSLVDKRNGREIAKWGKALNTLTVYENKPHNYDAWDVNIYYSRKHWDVTDVKSIDVIAKGPVVSIVRVKYQYLNSTIDQDIMIYQDIDRIDFKTHANFYEQQYLLKAHFPVDLLYNEATFDIQYGNLKRGTTKNTSWDVARFEVCAHKWVDVSEAGYGFALMNDCKYGHSVDEDSLALTLLKTSTSPDESADQCEHNLTYSIMPHMGSWQEANVPDMAYRLNVPVLMTAGAKKDSGMAGSMFSVSHRNMVIESVKGAQDGDGFIVRLYENHGKRLMEGELMFGLPVTYVAECDLLERPCDGLGAEADKGILTVGFELKPYEIKSFRVR